MTRQQAQFKLVTPSSSRVTLGEIITAYRLRKIHSFTGRPLSQEELALAIGSGQSHISRIESNLKIPQYATLVQICDALELSPSERAYLLSSAGYKLKSSLPDAKTVELVLSKLAPFLDSCPYPATLIDEGERIWHLNLLAAAVWGSWTFGAEDQFSCNRAAQGKRFVELIFDPDVYRERLRFWKPHYEEADDCLNRGVALFWRACRLHPDDQAMREVVARLTTNQDFLHRWQRLERGDGDLLFIEHSRYSLRHPQLGLLRYNAWRTHFMSDERFIVTHCTPIDHATSEVFRKLARKLHH